MSSADIRKSNISSVKRICGSHMDRDGEDKRKHSNSNINKELSSCNYHVGCESFREAIDSAEKRLHDVDAILPPKRKRKDRVEVLMVELPCPREITEQGRSPEFFNKLNSCMSDFFGKENWHGMEIHVDEVHKYYDAHLHKDCISLEHAHGLATPFVEGKGVNGKEFVTKQKLRDLTECINEMCEREFGIKYRTYSDPQKKSVEELKSETNKAREELQKVLDEKDKIITLKDSEIADKDKIIKQQTNDIKSLSDSNAELQFNIMDKSDTISRMDKTIKEQAVKYNDLVKATSGKQSEYEVFKKSIDELNKMYGKLQKVVAAQQKIISKLALEIKALISERVRQAQELDTQSIKDKGGISLFGKEKSAIVTRDYEDVMRRTEQLEKLSKQLMDVPEDDVKMMAIANKNNSDMRLMEVKEKRLESAQKALQSEIDKGVKERMNEIIFPDMKSFERDFIEKHGLGSEFARDLKQNIKIPEKDMADVFEDFGDDFGER